MEDENNPMWWLFVQNVSDMIPSIRRSDIDPTDPFQQSAAVTACIDAMELQMMGIKP